MPISKLLLKLFPIIDSRLQIIPVCFKLLEFNKLVHNGHQCEYKYRQSNLVADIFEPFIWEVGILALENLSDQLLIKVLLEVEPNDDGQSNHICAETYKNSEHDQCILICLVMVSDFVNQRFNNHIEKSIEYEDHKRCENVVDSAVNMENQVILADFLSLEVGILYVEEVLYILWHLSSSITFIVFKSDFEAV